MYAFNFISPTLKIDRRFVIKHSTCIQTYCAFSFDSSSEICNKTLHIHPDIFCLFVRQFQLYIFCPISISQCLSSTHIILCKILDMPSMLLLYRINFHNPRWSAYTMLMNYTLLHSLFRYLIF